jgi:hypothetical protein
MNDMKNMNNIVNNILNSIMTNVVDILTDNFTIVQSEHVPRPTCHR